MPLAPTQGGWSHCHFVVGFHSGMVLNGPPPLEDHGGAWGHYSLTNYPQNQCSTGVYQFVGLDIWRISLVLVLGSPRLHCLGCAGGSRTGWAALTQGSQGDAVTSWGSLHARWGLEFQYGKSSSKKRPPTHLQDLGAKVERILLGCAQITYLHSAV